MANQGQRGGYGKKLKSCLMCSTGHAAAGAYCTTCQTYVDNEERRKADARRQQRGRTTSQPGHNAGNHWVDAAVDTINDIEYGVARFANDVLHGSVDVANSAVRVAVAAPAVATNVAIGTTGAVVGTVAPACCPPVSHSSQRAALRERVVADYPELAMHEVEAVVDEIMGDGEHLVDSVLSGNKAAAAAAAPAIPATPASVAVSPVQVQTPKPAGARASFATLASPASENPPADCACHGCVVKRSMDSFAAARAGAQATPDAVATPPAAVTPNAGNQVPHEVADEYRRRWTGGRSATRVHHKPHHHRRTHADAMNEPSRAAYARAETDVDLALRKAGFSYDCHSCQTNVQTSKCSGCGEKVPQTYIDSTLGGPSAGSQFMDFLSEGVENLNITFGM